MALSGRLYGISVGGELVNCEIDCSLDVTRETVNKSGSHGGAARHYRYGYYNWSISMNAKSVISILRGSFNNLLISQLQGQELEVYIMARVSNIQEMKIGGKVLIPNLNITFPNIGASTFSVSFQGTGELTTEFQEFFTIINSMPATSEKNLVVDTNTWL